MEKIYLEILLVQITILYGYRSNIDIIIHILGIC